MIEGGNGRENKKKNVVKETITYFSEKEEKEEEKEMKNRED